jgi:hypothetical protein
MSKVRFHWSYPINVDIDTDKNVDVYIDNYGHGKPRSGDVRIVIIQEPFLTDQHVLYQYILYNQDKYTHLLTYYDSLLKMIPKAKLLMATTSWVQGLVIPSHKFCVSTLVGGKDNPAMEGYKLRHDLWRAQEQITIPRDFCLSGELRWAEADYTKNKFLEGSIVPLSKAPLFESQFHIAIENTSIKNMFTEKLIDCFQTKTVPIYWGCTNIGDFFNAKGILVARNLQEIVDICNRLTPETYNEMLPAIEANYVLSHKYCVYDEQIRNAVIDLIK